MNPKKNGILLIMPLVLFFLLVSTAGSQVQTTTNTTSGQPTTQTSVERGEVVSVDGNDLIVKMEDGSLRHFANVSESARVTVDGKELGIHELKPGMKLERTISTTTTPKTITTVQTVTGKVWHVMPPHTVILRLEDNTTQKFTVPQGQKFMVNGQETDVFDLKQGMKISATKVVEVPQTVVEEQRKVTGTMPPPPPAPAPDQPIIIAMVPVPAAPAAAPATEEPSKEAQTLPKTASLVPLLGLLGSLFFTAGFAVRAIRLVRGDRES